MQLRGVVSSGLGRASVFMAQDHYQDQFEQIVGARVWPGTLNIRVEGEDLVRYISLRHLSGIDTLGLDEKLLESSSTVEVSGLEPHRVRGFLRDGISFGGATAFIASIEVNGNKVNHSAVLIPDLTRHTDVVEFISPEFLRETLDVEDGDEVTIHLE